MSAPSVNLSGVRKQPMNRQQANHLFTDRYPALSDITSHGGMPGVVYALVHAAAVGQFQSRGWDLVARLGVITIRISTGPKAGDHPAMLMCNGRPIPGVTALGSVRDFRIDDSLDEATGLGKPKAAESPAAAPPAPKVRTAG